MGKPLTHIMPYLQSARKDFFTPFVLKLAFLPLVFSLLFWGVIFYFFGGNWFLDLYSFIRPDLSIKTSWLSWIQSLLDYTIKSTLFVFLAILFLVLTLISNLIICSFLTPFVINFIHKKHYSNLSIQADTSLISSIFSLIFTYLFYALFLILLIPFYFIPFIGTLLILLPNYWLFSKTLISDVGENIFSQKEFKEIKKNHKTPIRNLILSLYGLSLIPFLNFFIPLFSLIALSHLFFHIKGGLDYGNPN